VLSTVHDFSAELPDFGRIYNLTTVAFFNSDKPNAAIRPIRLKVVSNGVAY